jgi:hypothetical protein
MAAVKQLYRSASVVSADRVVFNIKGNDYRPVSCGRSLWNCRLSSEAETATREAEDMRKKRNLFDELMEGLDALADQHAGKRTLRTHAVKSKPAPKISADEGACPRAARTS